MARASGGGLGSIGSAAHPQVVAGKHILAELRLDDDPHQPVRLVRCF